MVTINKVKGQPTVWEKILANHVSDEGLILKINKNKPLSTNKTQPSSKKMGRGSVLTSVCIYSCIYMCIFICLYA